MKKSFVSPPTGYRWFVSFTLLVALVIGTSISAMAAGNVDDSILAEGTWVKKSQKISGSWKIVQRGSDRFLIANEDFKTRNAPDLKIVFSPLPIEKVNNKNASVGSRLLAPLPTVRGEFAIKLPANLDLDDFESVLINCEKYTKLWGGADLR